MRFKNLGLIIVDEEHRFGVRDKERLKALRTEADVLTLTATPIPRTLNMALGRLRDLSLIATPPETRLSIKTFVTRFEDRVVREACLRELKRGGQVYFVHNHIEDIEKIAADLAELVPEARMEVAHGQMRERDLEQIMLDFHHRRFHILVCTAIIESGLDIPSANTIIINRADRFGLAQLHQLRGRVGRSHHQAFAYLLAPPREALTADAIKRLDAIAALEDLGSGFMLATHDMEIRGAGELLGEDQSGQIQEIGFELYNDMLTRTVKALQDGLEPDLDSAMAPVTEINLHLPALLPDDYLPDVHLRLVHYKRIASARSDAGAAGIAGGAGGPLRPAARSHPPPVPHDGAPPAGGTPVDPAARCQRGWRLRRVRTAHDAEPRLDRDPAADCADDLPPGPAAEIPVFSRAGGSRGAVRVRGEADRRDACASGKADFTRQAGCGQPATVLSTGDRNHASPPRPHRPRCADPERVREPVHERPPAGNGSGCRSAAGRRARAAHAGEVTRAESEPGDH